MQWPRLILPVKTKLLNLSLGGATCFISIDVTDVFRTTQYTRNRANCFRHFEDVDLFLAHPVHVCDSLAAE